MDRRERWDTVGRGRKDKDGTELEGINSKAAKRLGYPEWTTATFDGTSDLRND